MYVSNDISEHVQLTRYIPQSLITATDVAHVIYSALQGMKQSIVSACSSNAAWECQHYIVIVVILLLIIIK